MRGSIKRLAAFLCAVLLLTLGACSYGTAAKQTATGHKITDSGTTSPAGQNSAESVSAPSETAEPAATRESRETDAEPVQKIAYVNYAWETRSYSACVNTDILYKTMAMSSVLHLPLFKFDAKAELEAFLTDFADLFSFDVEYDGFPSFRQIADAYGEDFFEENCLLCVYVTAGSGSFRYAARDLTREGGALCVNVEKTNDPESYTADMAGRLIVVEQAKDDLRDVTDFDALYVGIREGAK